jgi:hypothetical protein
MKKKWDVFISHASEDKHVVVRELADRLEKQGVQVWFDEYSLRVGDILSKSIDEGLLQSDFGIVIISPNFLNKKWPDYEYRSLLMKEENGNKVILPIWHDISHQEIKAFSLYLTDKLALDTSSMSTEKIVLKVVEVVRPDIYRNLKAYCLFKEEIKDAQTVEVEFSKISSSGKPKSKLSKQQEVRVRSIYYGIGRVLEWTMEGHIAAYEMDIHPEREIQVWEIMNLCYLEFIDKNKIETDENKVEVYKLLLGISLGLTYEAQQLGDEQKIELIELWNKYAHEY